MNRRLVTAALAVAAVITAAAARHSRRRQVRASRNAATRLMPLDPRVSVANPVGTLMYERSYTRCARRSRRR
jgi:hypothetical protein